ncbi:hypothetical protein MT349_05180 [Rathayibacter caricis]|uniref:hypothetical protein n=1 Tax=Rathayibacter caricis TaxID=110936 RepID=UPI001FB2B0AF|nr:hypothetical protein [Rathayibacter caricis]MCJ1695167.1 hypothetical protein [Rathayibacter caricis]
MIGPSTSGKSTLAAAIGHSRGLPVVHLDQYRHRPGTAWVERPDDEFAALHGEAVRGERWVIEGNYSRWLPERLERATGVVLLDATTPTSVFRYLRRTWSPVDRIGGLEGTRDRVSLAMLRFLVGPARAGRLRLLRAFEAVDAPKLLLPDRRALERFRRENGLPEHAPATRAAVRTGRRR